MSFTSQVANWSSKTRQDIAEEHKAIIFELFTSVIKDTPVLEGRLRGNWIMTFDTPSGTTLEIAGNTIIIGIIQPERRNERKGHRHGNQQYVCRACQVSKR